MSQVTNLKSVGFTWKKIVNLLGSPQVFHPHISAIFDLVVDGVAELVFVSVVVEADDSPAPTL